MPIVTVGLDLIDEGWNAVRLARYAQMAGFSECAFWGVFDATDPQNSACRPIQSLSERAMIARYLAEAQDEIEMVTGYPLSARWFTDELEYSPIVHAKRHKLIEIGVMAVDDVSLGAAVSHATDPAVVGPVATTVTDATEIHVYHPGTDVEIDPSAIVIAAGNVTISIPRCRLVSDPDNPDNGWDYTDIPPSATTPFESTVDIKRVYNDDTTQGLFIWPHQTGEGCTCGCCAVCDEYTHEACAYLRNNESGAIDLLYAHLIGSVWTASCPCACTLPQLVQVNYRAGLTTITKQAEDAVIRLAHSKMPKPPCGCGPLMEMWARDRNTPDVLTSERENCPFGMSDGAWIAYKFACAMRVFRLGML
jgi:hypothetical protein